MKTRVNVAELLQTVQDNRAKHRAVFEKALEGYRQEGLRILEDRVKDLAAGKTPDIRIIVNRPEDHTSDYDRVIRMLQMSVDNIFELDDRTFAQFVMDDWDWKRQWLDSSNLYAAGTVKQVYGDTGE